MYNIAVYSGHNASVTISKDSTILEILEIERFINFKNSGILWYLFPHDYTQIIKQILFYFKIKYGANEYENLICNNDDTANYVKKLGSVQEFLKFFNAKNIIQVGHQEGHAYSAFYQSNYDNATIISFDGGGNDGCFNFYNANRNSGIDFIYKNEQYNLGEKYSEIGHHCTSIKRENTVNMYLVYAGKLMGLAAYGKVKNELVPAMREFYTGHHWERYMRDDNYEKFKNAAFLPEELTGQLELDVVKTSQKVFEDIFYEVSKDYIHNNNNLILTGGCALNIINNTKINKITKTFVPPNPNDCGLSLGFMLKYLKPETAFDATYMGPEVWDRFQLTEYLNEYKAVSVNEYKIVEDILNGKIIGIVRGRSEVGPRALGNRSIICNPCMMDMKNILNMKVKNREWFRPFAPVVRLEDVNKYFEFSDESRWMSFCPDVKDEYKNVLRAITHVDGTARVQTVTKEQNEFLYSLLTIMHEKTGIGILLNTSFNINGKPILNSYKDALWMLNNTKMDSLILEDYHIVK